MPHPWALAALALVQRARAARVALCLAGQTRTFIRSAVSDNIYDSHVGPLRAAGHTVDAFWMLDANASTHVTADMRLWRASGGGAGGAALQRAERAFAPVAVAWAGVDETHPPPALCEHGCGSHGMGCRGLGMAFHQHRCLEAARAREREHGAYDWFVYARPDSVHGAALTGPALDAAAEAAAAVKTEAGVAFARRGRCHSPDYCLADTWALLDRRGGGGGPPRPPRR
mmetsp:Transcript_20578/g.61372  ORF Transcript_20578/g.61372 Transcript_20578/m.61372 type:complete len:228 (+) Transcript_20578:188-871(+)